MLTETGQVVAIDGDQAVVRVLRQSACQSCSARSTCGQGALGALLDKKCMDLRVENSFQVREGDVVELGLPDGEVVRTAFQLYILPLVGMATLSGIGLAVAELAGLVAYKDLFMIGFGVVGFGGSFLALSSFFAGQARALPRMTRVLSRHHASMLSDVVANN